MTDHEIVRRIDSVINDHNDRALHDCLLSVALHVADHELAHHVYLVLYCLHLTLTGCAIPDDIDRAWDNAAVDWDSLADRILNSPEA